MNVSQLIVDGMASTQRSPDGLLHASSHLSSNLRHTLLSFHPDIPRGVPDIVSVVRMQTGTLWHAEMERWFKGRPAMLEVDLSPWMPEGWGGRADYIIWDDEVKAFRLVDLKTIKGDGIVWKKKNGAAEAHVWQTSLYWWACWEMGLPMWNEITVLYLPMNVAPGAELLEINFEPLSFDQVAERCRDRKRHLKHFVDHGYNLNYLPPSPGRVQRKYKGVDGKMDVKLVPHWEAQFCPYPPPYCDCSTLKTTKIGHYDQDGVYFPRKGFEDIQPEV